MENCLINVLGRVQGVGFRYFCLRLALKYNLQGYAKNLSDGSVEILLQGSSLKIEEFLFEMSKGNKFIQVTSFTKKLNEIDLNIKKFNVL